MIMDDGDIIRDYKAAANKFRQVQILADQNCVKNSPMAAWLYAHGCEVDKRYMRYVKSNRGPEPAEEEAAPELLPAEPDPDPDQTVKADAGKPRLTLVPMQIMFDIAKVREYGNRKYPEGGPDNWRRVEPERYREAAFRHFLQYIDDPDGVDEESGLTHLSHLACNIAFLCELEKNGGETA